MSSFLYIFSQMKINWLYCVVCILGKMLYILTTLAPAEYFLSNLTKEASAEPTLKK